MSDALVQSCWDDHLAWSETANRLKRRVVTARKAVLALTMLGAILETLAATCASLRLEAGVAGAIALAVVPVLSGYFLKIENTRSWLRARSVSEGIKSEVFRFRAGADPYTGPEAADALLAKVGETRSFAADLANEAARSGQPSAAAPPPLDQAAYVRDRVEEQISEYYQPKAEANARLADRFRVAEIVVALLAAGLGAVATHPLVSSSGSLAAWVAVLTTLAGSLAAHAAASHYVFQSTTYFATARQLKDLVTEWRRAKEALPQAAWSAFVDRCELAISAENRGWMAKLDSK